MHVLEWLVSLLAPHVCLRCGQEGLPACLDCLNKDGLMVRTVVAHQSYLPTVWAMTTHDGLAKELVASMKFKRQKAAARLLGEVLALNLPPLPAETIVCPIPTASNRIRQRGYDHARIMAREFARKRQLIYRDALVRLTHTRQVGADRRQRHLQLKGAFGIRQSRHIADKPIVIIDDVYTTGATLVAAAELLMKHGVQSVSGAVYAQAKPKKVSSSSTRSAAQ